MLVVRYRRARLVRQQVTPFTVSVIAVRIQVCSGVCSTYSLRPCFQGASVSGRRRLLLGLLCAIEIAANECVKVMLSVFDQATDLHIGKTVSTSALPDCKRLLGNSEISSSFSASEKLGVRFVHSKRSWVCIHCFSFFRLVWLPVGVLIDYKLPDTEIYGTHTTRGTQPARLMNTN